MSKGCPHDATGICPRDCINTICDCDWYERADAMEMLDAYDVDFSVAHKDCKAA